MRGLKIGIGILILLAVIFVVIMVTSARQSSNQQTPDPNTYDPPPWANAIGSLLSPFRPKLKLGRNTFTFGFLPKSERVPPANDKFRSATFHVTQGCRSIPQAGGGAIQDCSSVVIDYQSTDGEGQNLKLDHQVWKPKHDDPARGSLVILKGEGTLTFRCLGMPSCTVVLE